MVADRHARPDRLAGLRRFAITISIFNLLGHTVFGFEQSWAHPLAALATAYCMELLLEYIESRAKGRTPKYAGSLRNFVEFLLPAHISALAVSMLLYPNERILPVCFAAAAAIGSKAIFRAPVGNTTCHVFNPSNFGITITLLLFHWVGAAPPYHFTENLFGALDWILPGLILVSGIFINARFTNKLPLVAGWLGGFVIQALLRSLIFGTPFLAALLPMTGLAFILYTFYMVTDPATTPIGKRAQIAFGTGVAGVYGLLIVLHIAFALFFALTIVSLIRGLSLYWLALVSHRGSAKSSVATPVALGANEIH